MDATDLLIFAVSYVVFRWYEYLAGGKDGHK